jgi:hypothetical protein
MTKHFIEDKEAIAALRFAMSFGHEPTPEETFEVLKEQGYILIKMVKDED